METDGSSAIVRRLRSRALRTLDEKRGREYARHIQRPRLRRLHLEWLHPVGVATVLMLAHPDVPTGRVLTVLYATGLVFWMAGLLRSRVHGRDAALTGYYPVSDAGYFDLQWSRVMAGTVVPSLVALWLLKPFLSYPSFLHPARLGDVLPSQAWGQGTWILYLLDSLGWPLLQLALIFPAALLVYRFTPNLKCRAVAVLVWGFAVVAAVLHPAVSWPLASLLLLPAGWIEGVQQVVTDVPRVAGLWQLLLIAPAVALLANYRHVLAAAAGTFHVVELILSTPNDPTPQVPTGPGSDENPADAVDTSLAARARRRQRRLLQEPTARQVLRSEIEEGQRLWGLGVIERTVGFLLSPRDRAVIRFLTGGRIDWSVRYRSALLVTLAGTVALLAPAAPILLRSLGQHLGLASLPSWNGTVEQVSVFLIIGGALVGACCLAHSMWKAAPLLGGDWCGLSSVPLASGAVSPMHAGFPIGFAEAYWAMLRVNAIRLLFWVPLLVVQVRVFTVAYWNQLNSGVWDALNLVPFVVAMFLMAQPCVLALRFLPVGPVSGGSQGVYLLATCLMFILYLVPQVLALGAFAQNDTAGMVLGGTLAGLASFLAFVAAYLMASTVAYDLLCASPDGGIVIDG